MLLSATLSKPTTEAEKVFNRPVIKIKLTASASASGYSYYMEQFTEKQVFHQHLTEDEASEFLEKHAGKTFKNCVERTEDKEITILANKKGKITKLLYFVFVFSMIVPFQMVMYTMTFVVNRFNFANIWGIVLVYLGFGAGLSVFMFTGFIKSIPLEIEEAAMIDGCNPLQTYFIVVFPMLKPTAITVAILQAMWVWNDYLLPYLILGSEHKTMPVAIQLAMNGAYGSTDYGAFMAMLVLSIIPIIVFYICSQKYIIKGVIAGAVKG